MTQYLEKLAREIYSEIGNSRNECVYQQSMEVALRSDGHSYCAQVTVPVMFRGIQVGVGIPDILLADLVVELKATKSRIGEGEIAQARCYLKALGMKRAVIINFGGELEYLEVVDSQES